MGHDAVSDFAGIATVTLQADDLGAARSFYAELFGIDAYFIQDAYIEFRIGIDETEFGILNRKYLPDLGGAHGSEGPGGLVVYWYVQDASAMVSKLVSMGAIVHQPPRDFGEGFVGASVIDPFGNILGVMNNPHFEQRQRARSEPLSGQAPSKTDQG